MAASFLAVLSFESVRIVALLLRLPDWRYQWSGITVRGREMLGGGCLNHSRMQPWVQRTTDGSGKTTVHKTHLDYLQHRAAYLICMLFNITIIHSANSGTHNECRKAWTYEHFSTAKPNSAALGSNTNVDAYRSYQRQGLELGL